jgi:hypothetical protein
VVGFALERHTLTNVLITGPYNILLKIEDPFCIQ